MVLIFFGNLFVLASLVLIGLAGFHHWPWWNVMCFGVAGFMAFQIATGFQAIRLTQETGLAFLWRHVAMAAIIYGVIWAIGYGASLLF